MMLASRLRPCLMPAARAPRKRKAVERRPLAIEGVAVPALRRPMVVDVPSFQPNAVKQAWQAYTQALKRRPLLVKSVTALICTVAGDSIAQTLAASACSPAAPYCALRSLELGAYSACVSAVAGHHWNKVLDGNVWPKAPREGRTVATKVLLDQLLFSPVMTAAWLAFVAAVLLGQPDNVVHFLQAKLVSTLLAGYTLWPAISCISFRFVPRDLRVLFGNCAGIAWGAYLSLTSLS